MTKHANILKFLKIVILILVAISFITNIVLLGYKDRFNKGIEEYISNELKLSPDTIDGELAQLDTWVKSFWSTEENRGRLYERMSNIYLWKGDSLNYYSCIGSSLYYLERSQNYTTLVNVYTDLANNYLLNGEVRVANKQLELVGEIMADNSDAVDDQMKSYLKRLEAISSFHKKEYNRTLELLTESDSYVDENEVWGPAYFTINSVNKAKAYLALGDMDKTAECLKECEDSGLLNMDVYVAIFDRDLVLPYYQVRCIYDVQTEGEQSSKEYLSKLVVLATKGDWQVCALDTLSSLKKQDVSVEYSECISDYIQKLYVSLAKSQTSNYVSLTNSQVQTSKENALRENVQKRKVIRQCIFGSLLFLGFLAVMFAMLQIIKSNYTDGLTKISNRKHLDRRLARLKKHGEPFVFIMIDIDNFKKVNDTYGHESGDEVLKELGKLLKEKYSNNNLHCFRYGGEEFSVVVRNCPVSGAVVIADSIRQAFSEMTWSFQEGFRITISSGVASSVGVEDVVKVADDNLYKAKMNGKNQVYTED